jgi:predicted transcriptional regulator
MEKTLADLKKIKDRIKEINEDIKPQLVMITELQEVYDEVLNEIIDNVEFGPNNL